MGQISSLAGHVAHFYPDFARETKREFVRFLS